ncbi:hypothetical protein M1432_03090 [Patescibacteria group bacterium]|nr:hypothetical protein [Patescibacteria group bacterium]
MERFSGPDFDNKETPPRELDAISEHQAEERSDQDYRIGQEFDNIVEAASRGFDRRRVDPENARSEVLDTIKNDPLASDIIYLKEKSIDQMIGIESLRNDEKLRTEMREAFLDRYQNVLVPGHVTGKGVKPPISLGFVVQKLDLAKAGVLKNENQIHYYEPGKENEIPPAVMARGLNLALPDSGADELQHPKSPTMAFFETAFALGLYDKQGTDDLKNMTYANVLTERVDMGYWLSDSAKNFFDENDMTLMKLNRLLPVDALRGLIRDLTKDEKLEIKGNPHFIEDAEKIIERVANIPLSPTLIAKYGLDKPGTDGKSVIEKQKESIVKSREYLESGKNVARNGMIYVKADENGKYEKLPASVLAVAAKPYKNRWAERKGYAEATKDHLLIFMRREDVNGLGTALDAAAVKSGKRVQMAPLGNLVRMSVIKPTDEVIETFEKNVLNPKTGGADNEHKEAGPTKPIRRIPQKHRANFKK